GEERRGPFAGRRREDRRVGENEPAAVEEVADRVDDLVTHAQDRLLPLAANPEMTPIQQVVGAVFLRRNRVVLRRADDLEALDVDLEATRRSFVRARRAGDDEGRLL